MSPPEKQPQLPLCMILLFVLPALFSGFMHGPEQQLQGLYAKYAGLALTALAAATLLTRAFDAVTYPVIGYLSDLTFARTGTRKHWVVGGAMISALGVWFLYRPPAGIGIVYYGVWAAVTYLGWKIAEIPYQAWSYGLTRDYKDRARVQAFRVFAVMLGNIGFFAMPALVHALGWAPTAALGFPALRLAAIVCAVVVPLVALLVIWRVPEGEAAQPSARAQRQYGVVETFRSLIENRPLLHLLVATTPIGVLGGMAGGVAFLFLDVYLHLGDAFPRVMLIAFPMGLIGIPLWSWLCIRFERHRVMAASALLSGLAFLGLALASPGPSSVIIVMIFYPLTVLAFSGMVALYPMMGDVADFGRLSTGKDLAGLYTAMLNFVQVSLRTVSVAAGIALVGWMGFNATVVTQSPGGAFGIRLVAVILPAIGSILAAVLFWTFPLTRARLAEIRRELAEQEAESALMPDR